MRTGVGEAVAVAVAVAEEGGDAETVAVGDGGALVPPQANEANAARTVSVVAASLNVTTLMLGGKRDPAKRNPHRLLPGYRWMIALWNESEC